MALFQNATSIYLCFIIIEPFPCFRFDFGLYSIKASTHNKNIDTELFQNKISATMASRTGPRSPCRR